MDFTGHIPQRTDQRNRSYTLEVAMGGIEVIKVDLVSCIGMKWIEDADLVFPYWWRSRSKKADLVFMYWREVDRR